MCSSECSTGSSACTASHGRSLFASARSSWRWSVPAAAQQRVQLEVSVAECERRPGVVTTVGPVRRLGACASWCAAGFPISLRFRLELWRSGGLFNDLEGTPGVGADRRRTIRRAQRYGVVRRQGGRMQDLGSFATLTTAQSVLERPLRITLQPQRAGRRYYYNSRSTSRRSR